MASNNHIKKKLGYFPFTEEEHEEYLQGRIKEPALFGKIREKAKKDQLAILDELLPIIVKCSETRSLSIRGVDGPFSRDAFHTRISDALMFHNLIATTQSENGPRIADDLYDDHLIEAARFFSDRNFSRWLAL